MTDTKVHQAIEKFANKDFKSFLIKSFQTLSPNTKFIDNWHVDLIIKYLEEVESGKIRRLIINIPPRSLKSTIISVAWPAWLLGLDPSRRIIVASYSQNLSLKHSLDSRLIVTSDWYKKLFPETRLRKGSNEKHKFMTTQNGFRFATSIDGTLTGEGADILIVDDPHTPLQAASKVERERALTWFDQTFSTRLNDKKKGKIIVVMQRLHSQDLTGHLVKKKVWTQLSLSATTEKEITYECDDFKYVRKAGELLNSKREGKEEIEMAKLELGSYGFNAQYLQEPLALDSGIIKADWISRTLSTQTEFEMVYQSWDCASKTSANADFSVCTTWGVAAGKIYLIGVTRGKYEYPELKSIAIRLAESYKPSAILIEDKSSGQALIQDLQQHHALPIIPINPLKDKFSRLLGASSYFESGKIVLPQDSVWLAEYEQELFNFPNAEHDDQVDSTSQFIEWFKKSNSGIMNLRIV